MSLAQLAPCAFNCDIVDDDPDAGDLVGRVVAQHGGVARRFWRIEEHIPALMKFHPDLIIMDIWLDGADALEAIPRYRACGYNGHVQILSALDTQQLFDVYAMCDRYGYRSLYPLAKPVRTSAVASALDHVRSLDADRRRVRPSGRREPRMGWMAPLDPGQAPSILVMSFSSVASGQNTLAQPELVNAVEMMRARFAETSGRRGTVPVWLMTTLSAGLRIPMADGSDVAHMAASGEVTFLVALGEANRAPETLLNLKARASQYHIGLSLFADDIEEFSLATLTCRAVSHVLLGENLIECIWTNTAARLMAERVFAACRNSGVSFAAACDPDGEPGRMLRRFGVACFTANDRDMHFVPDFLNAPLPRWTDMPARYDQSLPPLPDFPGRHLLTKREQQIVQLTAYGQSAKEAGLTLGLSYRTVEVHRTNIFAKLGVRNVAQLTHLAFGGR